MCHEEKVTNWFKEGKWDLDQSFQAIGKFYIIAR